MSATMVVLHTLVQEPLADCEPFGFVFVGSMSRRAVILSHDCFLARERGSEKNRNGLMRGLKLWSLKSLKQHQLATC